MINCLIIDDEAPSRRIVQKYLETVPDVTVLGECRNAFEAMEAIPIHNPDLIFLDINMPKLTGIDFIKALDKPPLIIITTAYREFAIEGFELDVVDYLHKPFSFERLLKALQKARTRLSLAQPRASEPQKIESDETGKSGFIFIKKDKQVIRVNLRDIVYAESMGDYVRLVTLKESMTTYMTLKKLEDMLPSHLFPRVHKSYIVHTAQIDSIEYNRVYIKGKDIPIGQKYRKKFMDLIKQ